MLIVVQRNRGPRKRFINLVVIQYTMRKLETVYAAEYSELDTLISSLRGANFEVRDGACGSYIYHPSLGNQKVGYMDGDAAIRLHILEIGNNPLKAFVKEYKSLARDSSPAEAGSPQG